MTLSLDKKKIKILLLEGLHKNAKKRFTELGYTNIEERSGALDKNELIEKIKDAHMVGLRSRTQLTAEVLENAKKLFTIGAFCIGTNQIDLEAAKLKGIPVFNAPFSNTRSVAEMVVAECVMLMRGISEKNVLAHQGKWAKSAIGSNEVRGKTLGIIGYGHIGSQVAVLAEAFGMNVVYYDIEEKLSIGNARSQGSLEDVLKQADILTLHVPATPETKEMIGEKEIKAMKKGSFLINASRGNVVVVPALVKALKDDHIAGAAIDVFPEEPKTKDHEFISDLRNFNNVILTPHVGGSTLEAQANIALEVTDKLAKYSDNGSTLSSVNFPEVNLPPNLGMKRFFHIHQNVPGVLKKINHVFSEKHINIAGQYLQTDPKIGYVVFDVEDKNIDRSLITELKNIEGTIRARMLN